MCLLVPFILLYMHLQDIYEILCVVLFVHVLMHIYLYLNTTLPIASDFQYTISLSTFLGLILWRHVFARMLDCNENEFPLREQLIIYDLGFSQQCLRTVLPSRMQHPCISVKVGRSFGGISRNKICARKQSSCLLHPPSSFQLTLRT